MRAFVLFFAFGRSVLLKRLIGLVGPIAARDGVVEDRTRERQHAAHRPRREPLPAQRREEVGEVLRLDLLDPASTKRLLDVRLVALPVQLEGALAHLTAADEARDHRFVLVPDLGELDSRGGDDLTRVRLDSLPLALLLRLRQRTV